MLEGWRTTTIEKEFIDAQTSHRLFDCLPRLSAGNLTGKVSAGKGNSSSVCGSHHRQDLPSSYDSEVMDQKSLLFPATRHGGPGRLSTVEFLNSDKVAHNIFWPAVSGNKKMSHNMGTCRAARSAALSSTHPAWCRCCATSTPRCRAISSSLPLRTSR